MPHIHTQPMAMNTHEIGKSHFIVDNFSEWDIVETGSYSLDKLRGK